mmetsp:Transcript_118597/g.193065  ORF Transcript_118597/g.193065 Transcript_118597/m.193065 type:complete len:99 (+) Transcript_118597:138-434(+)
MAMTKVVTAAMVVVMGMDTRATALLVTIVQGTAMGTMTTTAQVMEMVLAMDTVKAKAMVQAMATVEAMARLQTPLQPMLPASHFLQCQDQVVHPHFRR